MTLEGIIEEQFNGCKVWFEWFLLHLIIIILRWLQLNKQHKYPIKFSAHKVLWGIIVKINDKDYLDFQSASEHSGLRVDEKTSEIIQYHTIIERNRKKHSQHSLFNVGQKRKNIQTSIEWNKTSIKANKKNIPPKKDRVGNNHIFCSNCVLLVCHFSWNGWKNTIR